MHCTLESVSLQMRWEVSLQISHRCTVNWKKGMKDIGESFQGVFRLLPEGIQTGWNAVVANLDNTMGNLIGKISEPTVEAAGNLAKSIPSILVSTIVTIVAAYFFYCRA